MARGGSRPGIRHQITHDRYLAAELGIVPSSSVAVIKHQGLECLRKLSHLQERCVSLAPSFELPPLAADSLVCIDRRVSEGLCESTIAYPGVYAMFDSQVGPRKVTRLATRNPSDMPPQVSQSDSKAHIGRASRVLRDDSEMNGMPVLLREDHLCLIKTATC